LQKTTPLRRDESQATGVGVKMNRAKLISLATFFLICAVTISAQSYQTGKILKWDTQPYAKNAHMVRNGVVYYIQIDKTVYQVTRRTTTPDTNLVAGQRVSCRIDKNQMFISVGNAKEAKYTILGASAED
jgi:hypothetical protein